MNPFPKICKGRDKDGNRGAYTFFENLIWVISSDADIYGDE
jgi:hypothetical protein